MRQAVVKPLRKLRAEIQALREDIKKLEKGKKDQKHRCKLLLPLFIALSFLLLWNITVTGLLLWRMIK